MKEIRSKVLDSVTVRRPGFLMRHGITVCVLTLLAAFLLFAKEYAALVRP